MLREIDPSTPNRANAPSHATGHRRPWGVLNVARGLAGAAIGALMFKDGFVAQGADARQLQQNNNNNNNNGGYNGGGYDGGGYGYYGGGYGGNVNNNNNNGRHLRGLVPPAVRSQAQYEDLMARV